MDLRNEVLLKDIEIDRQIYRQIDIALQNVAEQVEENKQDIIGALVPALYEIIQVKENDFKSKIKLNIFESPLKARINPEKLNLYEKIVRELWPKCLDGCEKLIKGYEFDGNFLPPRPSRARRGCPTGCPRCRRA